MVTSPRKCLPVSERESARPCMSTDSDCESSDSPQRQPQMCVCECHWVMVSHSGRLRSVSPNQTSEISSYSACVGRGGSGEGVGESPHIFYLFISFLIYYTCHLNA